MVPFELSFHGRSADSHQIDFYDVSRALIGFQRSLAIATHLVINGEIITQAPSLRGASILAAPPKDGSWKFRATVILIGGAVYSLGVAPKDTALGNLVSSVYDYIISESLGFHVDYDKTLGQQYDELHQSAPPLKIPRESQLDSAVEKSEAAIRDMHRPVVFSETALYAQLLRVRVGKDEPIGPSMDHDTFAYIAHTEREADVADYIGWVSSYNINTFKGRIYIGNFHRSIPFQLGDTARSNWKVGLITASLNMNARERLVVGGEVVISAARNVSVTGRLKSLYVSDARRASDDDFL